MKQTFYKSTQNYLAIPCHAMLEGFVANGPDGVRSSCQCFIAFPCNNYTQKPMNIKINGLYDINGNKIYPYFLSQDPSRPYNAGKPVSKKRPSIVRRRRTWKRQWEEQLFFISDASRNVDA